MSSRLVNLAKMETHARSGHCQEIRLRGNNGYSACCFVVYAGEHAVQEWPEYHRAGNMTTVQAPVAEPPGRSIAIVGLACRFPDADDPAALLDMVLTGRRAFRRIPRARLELADYYSPDPDAPDTTYGTRAALIDGWRFDQASFGVAASTYASADPAHWLALETADRALAAAGFPRGAGLPGATSGVYIGSGVSGDSSPAAALRLRWPYSRRVIAEALAAAGVPARLVGQVLDATADRFLAPLPPVTAETLTGSTPESIAAGICRQFGLGGGGVTVAAGGSSSLAAVASACLALAARELDAALAGGVDLCVGPLDLVGLAKSGLLAVGDMRVYDERPTGFLPGEGCGIVVLMRADDAKAASLPVYAEIIGWGSASDDGPGGREPGAGAQQLLAMRRAVDMAGVDPGDIQLVEGCGTGVGACDQAELAALAELRAGSGQIAAFGSVSANIGYTRAAAGGAGLIKSVLAMANGVQPPATGVQTPHEMLRDGQAALSLPAAPQPWPSGVRHAAVGAAGPEGLAVHVVLRGEAGGAGADAGRPQPGAHSPPRAAQVRPAPSARSRRLVKARGKTVVRTAYLSEHAPPLEATSSAGGYAFGAEHPFAYLLHAPDQAAMIAILARLAAIGPWLSDAELQDLAVSLAGADRAAGAAVRIALTASSQDELAGLASEAMRLLPGLSGTTLRARPGIYVGPGAGDGAGALVAGDVALVIAGQADDLSELPQRQLTRTLEVLRWLDELGVTADAAVGHGIGELAGLVWAGCATPPDARMLAALRSAALAAPPDAVSGQLGNTISQFNNFTFRPPRRRLISGSTGRDVLEPAAIAEVLSAELFTARLAAAGEVSFGSPGENSLAAAIAAVSPGTRLLIMTGADQYLTTAVAATETRVGPAGTGAARRVVSIEGDPADDGSVAHAAAALFAAGALARPQALYAARPSRPFDIWREQVFLTHPCEASRPEPAAPCEPAPPEPAPPEPAPPEPAPPEPAEAADATVAGSAPGSVNGWAAGSSEKSGDLGWGAGPWVRCYAERTQPACLPVQADDDRPWRIYMGGCEPLRRKVADLFRHDPAANRTLALIGGLDDAAAREAAVLAARDAIRTGSLVSIGPGPTSAGLFASLNAEHPALGITVVQTALSEEGLSAARGVAAAQPGEYRELSIGLDGAPAESVVTLLPGLGGGPFPLGPEDVVLITRASGAAGLVLAQVLACSGSAMVVMGRNHSDRDDSVVAGLEKLRGAGAKIGYELVELADHASLTAAVRRMEARFGRVTAISHAAGPVTRLAIAELTPSQADDYVRRHVSPLDRLAAAVRAAGRSSGLRQGPLRLVVTSGSVIGRYGMAGEAPVALVTGALADFAQQLAAASPGCNALHIDWPAWSGDGLGERADLTERMIEAGFAPMPVAEGSRQLLKLLASGGLPSRVAVHGRVGVPAPRPIAAGAVKDAMTGPNADGADGTEHARARFVERVLVHYPGVELIAEASLSLDTDPYLDDYRLDGVSVLPPAMALEAMAQVASVLSGEPARRACGVRMSAPIVLPPGAPGSRTVIRLAGLRDGDAVTVILRSDNSGFGVEHCRAVFSTSQGPAGPAPDEPAPAERAGASVQVCELYGAVLFQAGRFRRLAEVRLDGDAGPDGSSASRAGIGLADRIDDLPWFGALPSSRAAGAAGQRGRPATNQTVSQRLVLGDAGLSDATLQLVQACGARRRIAFAGCDEVAFAGHELDGLVTIRAAVRKQAGKVPQTRPSEHHSSGLDDQARWDVDATDSAGRLLIAWKGLRMRDAGPQPQLRRSSEPEMPASHTAASAALTGAMTASWRSARPRLVSATISDSC
jgi:enediyne polyketide synthase